jgi:hypothetical protein
MMEHPKWVVWRYWAAGRIFNHQNPGCKITSLPTEVREDATRR